MQCGGSRAGRDNRMAVGKQSAVSTLSKYDYPCFMDERKDSKKLKNLKLLN